jgi:putative PEP-CTERM system TPR-repeat lipoprotein
MLHISRFLLPFRPAMFLLVVVAAACTRDGEALARKHMEQGNAFFNQQQYAKAVIEFRNAVKATPRDGRARLRLGQAFVKVGDTRNAIREYVRAADLLPDDDNVQLEAGNALLVAGEFDRARAIAEALLQKNRRNVAAQMLRGYALAGLKDVATAITQLEEALAEDSTQIGHINIGELYLSQGQLASAEGSFKEAIKLDPSNVTARLALANFYWSTQRLPEAGQTLEQTIAQHPDDVLANRAMAMYLLRAGQIEGAERYLRRSAELSPTPDESLFLSDYYIALGRYDDARAVLEPITSRQKPPVGAVLRLAEAHYALDRKEQAHSAVDALLKANPRSAPALVLKARFLVVDGKPQDGLALATQATEADPTVFAGHFARGIALAALRDHAEATKAFSEALRLRPRAFDVHVQLSRLHLAQGATDLAVQFARSALALQPQNRNAHRTLAQALFARRDFDAAEAETRVLLAEHPNWAQSHVQHGYLLVGRRDPAGAMLAFQRALELDPKADDALRMLAVMEVDQKKSTQAWARVNRRLAQSPDNPELLLLAADLHTAERNEARAEQTLLQVVQVSPNNLEAYARLGQLYLSQRRLDPARIKFEEMATRFPKAAGPVTMIGYIYELQQKTGEAKKAYERALQIDSRAAVAANNLAWLYAMEGTNLDMAVQLAQTAKQVLPDEPAVDDTLGMAYYKKELPHLAIPILLQGVQKQPKNAVFQYHLGLAYAKAGDNERARTALKQALSLQGDFDGAADARRVLATLP